MVSKKDPSPTLIRMALQIPEKRAAAFSASLAQFVPWGWEEETGAADASLFTVHCDTFEQARHLLNSLQSHFPELQAQLHEDKRQEWALSWRAFFHPLDIAETFLVLPSWERPEFSVRNRMPIYIEPKMAFGTGHHATTALCLEALAEDRSTLDPSTPFLDLGTGSGILGIGCAQCGLHGLGLDTDPVAIGNAAENRSLNTASALELAVGGVESLSPSASFGLILANILAGPLQDMATALVAHLRPGGRLILSGILATQSENVVQTYQALGLGWPRILHQGEWVALYWPQTPSR
ncbi:MAG: 50S ribosomal protein L11 methyltransferase [Thermodesulfobacteriota bacterium]